MIGNTAIRKFKLNTVGRDFVCGDIHGCFDHVDRALTAVGFDGLVDRLFCCGDLVDRGPDSIAAHYWLSLPWFFAVRGNHEQMCVDSVYGDIGMTNPWLHRDRNGGAWFYDLVKSAQDELGDIFADMPLAFEIETPQGRVGIIHAEPGQDWAAIPALLQENPVGFMEMCLWSRDRIKYFRADTTPVANIDQVYVGHTVLKETMQIGNINYIDTGLVHGNKLTLVNLHDLSVHQEPY